VIVSALLVLAILVFGRRWIHHAQLELTPVMVPATAEPASIEKPPASLVLRRMWRYVSETIAPPNRARLAVLTFDDGPYPVMTSLLVAQLQALNVPADFFLIGQDVIQQPAIAARLASAGMEVGNHTLSHPQMPSLLWPAQLEEVADGAAAIRHISNLPVRYFRPPHGSYNAATLQAAFVANETVVFWDVDPGDWRTLSVDIDPALRHGLAALGAEHTVADARALPFPAARVDAIAAEPPYDADAAALLGPAMAELARVLKPAGCLALLCAAWQAPALGAHARALGLTPFLDTSIDRKGLEAVALAWEKAGPGT